MAAVVEAPFPQHIDNTMRATFVACPKQFYWKFIRCKSMKASIHLIAGGAFARGLEVFRKNFYANGGTYDASLALGMKELILHYGTPTVPEGNNKSLDKLLLAYDAYWTQYPPKTDPIQPNDLEGVPAVECSFSIPLPINNPDTGEPLIYCGRYDMLGTFNGVTWVVDEKTASSLGPKWSEQFHLRSQMTGYCWAARQYGHSVVGAIIRGIAVLKNDTKFQQVITYRDAWQIEQWYNQLLKDIQRMVDTYTSGYYDMNLADACTSYGGCEYVPLCTKQDPEPWLDDYHDYHWSPIETNEEKKIVTV